MRSSNPANPVNNTFASEAQARRAHRHKLRKYAAELMRGYDRVDVHRMPTEDRLRLREWIRGVRAWVLRDYPYPKVPPKKKRGVTTGALPIVSGNMYIRERDRVLISPTIQGGTRGK
jgi:hypothetical protein